MLDIDEYIKKYRQPYNPDFKPAPIQQKQTSSKSIDDFVKDYTADRKRTTPGTTPDPVSTTIPKTQIQTPVVTKKDYFKDSQVNAEANKTPTTSKAWTGMSIKDNIIPQAKDFTPAKLVEPEKDKGMDWVKDISKSFLEYAFGSKLKKAAGNEETKKVGDAAQARALKTATTATEQATGSAEQKIKSMLTDIRFGGATVTMRTEDFDNITKAVDIVVKGYNDQIIKDIPDNALGRLSLAPVSGALEGVAGVYQGVGAVSDLGNLITKGVTGNKNNSFSSSTLIGNMTQGMTKEAYQEVRSNAGKVEGYASDLLNSAGRMLPGILAGGAGGAIAGNVTSALNYGGSSFAQDVKDGKTYEQALIHGTFTGIAEAYLQYYLGRLPGLSKVKGEGFVDKLFARQLSSLDNVIKTSVKSPVLQKLFKTAIVTTTGGLSEATEETLQQVMGNAYQKFIYKEKTPMNEGLWQSAWMGFAMSALLGVGGNVQQGMSFNEKAQVEEVSAGLKEMAERQVEQIEDIKFTPEQIAGILTTLQTNLAEETDTTVKAKIQTEIDNVTAKYVTAEISTKTPQIDELPVGVQVDAQQANNSATQATTAETDAKMQSDKMFDDMLKESTKDRWVIMSNDVMPGYNPNENGLYEVFAADLEQAKSNFKEQYGTSKVRLVMPMYDYRINQDILQKQKEQSVTAQGVQDTETQPVAQAQTTDNIFDLKLAQNTQTEPMAVAELTVDENNLVQMAKTKFNREVIITDSLPGNAEGMYDKGKIYVGRNADNVYYVFGHELTHSLEVGKDNQQAYNRLSRYVADTVIGRKNMQAEIETTKQRYAEIKPDMTDGEAYTEVIAKATGKYLFTDADAIAKIVRTDRSLASKIVQFLRETATRLAGTKEQKAVLKAIDLYRAALKQANTTENGKTQFSTGEDFTNQQGYKELNQIFTSFAKRYGISRSISNDELFRLAYLSEEVNGRYARAMDDCQKFIRGLLRQSTGRSLPGNKSEYVTPDAKSLYESLDEIDVSISKSDFRSAEWNAYQGENQAPKSNVVDIATKKTIAPIESAAQTQVRQNKVTDINNVSTSVTNDTIEGAIYSLWSLTGKENSPYDADILRMQYNGMQERGEIDNPNSVTIRIKNESTNIVAKFIKNQDGTIDITAKSNETAKYSIPEDYAMQHRPTESGAIASDISTNGEYMPKDVYTHPEWYFQLSGNDDFSRASRESWAVIRRIKGNPNAKVTIYRATVKNEFNSGDWVTPSPTYAKIHAERANENKRESDLQSKVFSRKVTAKDIQFAGDDINEFGYYPQTESAKYSIPEDKSPEEVQAVIDKGIEDSGYKEPVTQEQLDNKQLIPNKIKKDGKSVTVRGVFNTSLHMGLKNSETYPDIIDKTIVNGNGTYTPESNKKTLEVAQKKIDMLGYEGALSEWEYKVENDVRIRDIDVATAELLYKAAIEGGQGDIARKLLSEIAMIGTENGQAIQIISLFNKLNGEAHLITAQKIADRLNKQTEEQRKKQDKAPIEIPDNLAEKVRKAKTPAEKDAAFMEIKQDMYDQLPYGTWWERWNAWRYISMLGNFKTNIRNVGGNMGMLPLVAAKNLQLISMEKVANDKRLAQLKNIQAQMSKVKTTAELVELLGKANREDTGYVERLTQQLKDAGQLFEASILKTEMLNLNKQIEDGIGIYRTRAFHKSKAAHDFAVEDFKARAKSVMSGSSKYMGIPNSEFNDRRIFKFGLFEGARKLTNKPLEYGDEVFINRYYVNALASFLDANNVDIDAAKQAGEAIAKGETPADENAAKMVNLAREYATQEAREATFRDFSLITETIVEFRDAKTVATKHGTERTLKQSERIARRIAVDSVLPFVGTLVNITRRGAWEYNVGGLAKTILFDTNKVKTGEMSATTYLNNIAKGTTGSAVVLMGYLLGAAGIIVGRLPEDKNEKDLAKTAGQQAYSLILGDHSYTIDWIAPFCIPLFLGVELSNLKKSSATQFKDYYQAGMNILSPLFELTLLKSVADVVKAVKYENEPAQMFGVGASTLGLNYLAQGTPTLFGQISRTITKEQKTSVVDEGNPFTRDQQLFVQKIMGKLFMNQNKQDYVNMFGETKDTGNVAQRIATNFFLPWYSSKLKDDATIKGMISLEKEKTDGLGVNAIPKIPSASLPGVGEYENKTFQLTADQLTELKKQVGIAQKLAADEFITSKNKVTLSTQYITGTSKDGYKNSLVSFTSVKNNSKGMYSDEDLKVKAIDKAMKKAYNDAVIEFIKAHNDLTLKK